MPFSAFGSAILALVASAPVAPGEEPYRDPSLHESIRVERVLLDVRVLDPLGSPVRGLTAPDFRLRVDGEVVPVSSVDWVEGFGGGPPAAAANSDPSDPDEAPGIVPTSPRYTVLLIQRDLDPSRIVQLMRLRTHVLELVDDMSDGDLLAVLIHENGLHVLADFTDDREGLRRVLDEAVVRRGPVPIVRPGGGASLREYLDEEALHEAAHVETALLRLAEVMDRLPGSKSVLFLAWGMGVFTGAGVLERPDQDRAVERLREANATLLTVDLTNADYHSLETPLIRATKATGGLYVKGHSRPAIALQRVRSAAQGHYVLAFAPAAGDDPPRSIRVSVPGTEYEVLYRESMGN